MKRLLHGGIASGLALSGIVMGLNSPAVAQPYQQPPFGQQPYQQAPLSYATLYQQGNDLYQQGRLSEALATYEKALPLAQGASIPIVYNNMAAIYMKRGNYYLSTENNVAKALADFRMAVFYLDIGWPAGLEHSANQAKNRTIAKGNLAATYRRGRFSIAPTDHRQRALDLRRQGKFPQAATEYYQVLQTKPTEALKAESLRGLGDIFLVLNRPHIAKKYYRQLLAALPNDADNDTDLKLRLANAEYKSGEVDAAIERLSAITDNEPNNAAALRQLEQLWRTELRYNPNDPVVHANLASIFQKQQQFGKALRAYTNAEKLALKTPGFDRQKAYELRLNAGTLHQAMGDMRLAEQAYTSVLQEAPTHARGLNLLATLYQTTGRQAQAMDILSRLVAANPDDVDGHTRLLALIRQQAPGPQRLASLTEYGHRYPTNPIVQQAVAETLHAEGDPASALPFYQQAVGLANSASSPSPSKTSQQKAALLANYATALQATQQPQAALSHLQQAQRLDPTNTTVLQLAKELQQQLWQGLYQQAIAAQQQQHWPQSIDFYNQTIAAAKEQNIYLPGDVLANYGLALQSSGDANAAITQYTQALRVTPTNGEWLYYRATAYHQTNQFDKAVGDYQQALLDQQLSPQTSEQITNALATIQASQVNQLLEEALAAYNRKAYLQALATLTTAQAQAPNNAFVAYYQGLVLDDQGNTTKAIAAYKRATTLDPTMADAYYGLAVAEDGAGNQTQALTAYQQYLAKTETSNTETARYAQSRVSDLLPDTPVEPTPSSTSPTPKLEKGAPTSSLATATENE